MKKIILAIISVFILFSSSFATVYKISKSDYNRVERVKNKVIQIVNHKYPNKKIYMIQKLIDTIDGYIYFHPQLSQRKKIILLCFKTELQKYLGYKVGSNGILVVVE